MKDGKPLTAIESWKTVEPWVIVECVYRAGLRSILLLDLARVGMNEGIGTEELLRRLQETYPDMDVIVGGGIRHPQDLDQAAGLGARAALVASALHDGSITVQDIQRARTLGRPMSCP
jgi:phosphoribosylformimino-5-aminoimidazole carboxamide ribotide isomerase